MAEGLYIGGAGAARNLKALRKRGITAVVNAAPSVPCYFRDNPEGAFTYLALPLFDDPEAGASWVLLAGWLGAAVDGCWLAGGAVGARWVLPRMCKACAAAHAAAPLCFPPPPSLADLAPHIEACDAFIGAARARGGAVLVHCYAGQSRSAALVVAHLMAGGRGLSLMDAWALVRRARPCAQPNSGFLRQLAALGKSLAAAAAGPAAEQPALQDSALALDAAR